MHVEMENRNTHSALHITQPESVPCSIHAHTHIYRAIFHRQSSASNSVTTIPLNNIGEGIWWLQFTQRDWKSLGFKSLKATVPLRALLAALGTQPNDNSDGDDDATGAASTLCLAPGLGQSKGKEGGEKEKWHAFGRDRRATHTTLTTLPALHSQTTNAFC